MLSTAAGTVHVVGGCLIGESSFLRLAVGFEFFTAFESSSFPIFKFNSHIILNGDGVLSR